MQPCQLVVGPLAKDAEEAAQGGLAGNRLDAQHLGYRRIALQPRHPRKLVRPTEHPTDKAQRYVGRHIRVGTAWIMGQHWGKFLPKALLVQKMGPEHHPAMRSQSLVGESDPNRRAALRRVNLQPHRLVRLWLRPSSLIVLHNS